MRGPASLAPPHPRPARMAPCLVGPRGCCCLLHTKAHRDSSWREVPPMHDPGLGVLWSRGAWVWVWVTLMLVAAPAHAKYVEGFLKTSERWAFLARFCFLSQDGTFSFEVKYNMRFATQRLLLYYDAPDQWPAVYGSTKTCEEREAALRPKNYQRINLTRPSILADCRVENLSGEASRYHCRGKNHFTSARERWWFIVASNCESTQGLELSYKLTMTNGYSYWYKHFSADEFYILRTDLTALVLQLGVVFLSLLCSAELKKREMLHTTYNLYLAAAVTQVFALVFLTIHYANYGFNGIGFPFSKLLGRVLHTASTVLMVVLLLLAAKGFNITRGRLRQNSAVRLTAFMCIYIVTCLGLFIYEQNVFDPGEVLYLYESPAGYGLVALRLLAWLMFLYSCFFTVKHYPEKNGFYGPFFALYSLWFLAGPVVVIISNHVIDKWVREKVVNGVDLVITLLGHIFFLILTRPSAANRNFPYHVRTAQVRAMEQSSTGVIGNNTLDAFSAHRYAPDLPESRTHAAPDLFLVSGAVEMIPLPTPKTILQQDSSYPHHPAGASPPLKEANNHTINPTAPPLTLAASEPRP